MGNLSAPLWWQEWGTSLVLPCRVQIEPTAVTMSGVTAHDFPYIAERTNWFARQLTQVWCLWWTVDRSLVGHVVCAAQMLGVLGKTAAVINITAIIPITISSLSQPSPPSPPSLPSQSLPSPSSLSPSSSRHPSKSQIIVLSHWNVHICQHIIHSV